MAVETRKMIRAKKNKITTADLTAQAVPGIAVNKRTLANIAHQGQPNRLCNLDRTAWISRMLNTESNRRT